MRVAVLVPEGQAVVTGAPVTAGATAEPVVTVVVVPVVVVPIVVLPVVVIPIVVVSVVVVSVVVAATSAVAVSASKDVEEPEKPDEYDDIMARHGGGAYLVFTPSSPGACLLLLPQEQEPPEGRKNRVSPSAASLFLLPQEL